MGCSFPSLINGKWFRARLSAWMCAVDKWRLFLPPPSLLTHGIASFRNTSCSPKWSRLNQQAARTMSGTESGSGGPGKSVSNKQAPRAGWGQGGGGAVTVWFMRAFVVPVYCLPRTGARTSWLACLWLKEINSHVQAVAWKRLSIKTQSPWEPFC